MRSDKTCRHHPAAASTTDERARKGKLVACSIHLSLALFLSHSIDIRPHWSTHPPHHRTFNHRTVGGTTCSALERGVGRHEGVSKHFWRQKFYTRILFFFPFQHSCRWVQHLLLSSTAQQHAGIAIHHGCTSRWRLSHLSIPFSQLTVKKTLHHPPPHHLLYSPSYIQAQSAGGSPWTWQFHCADLQPVVAKWCCGVGEPRK